MIAARIEKSPLPRPDWFQESVWPFPTFGMDVDGVRLAVTDVGQGPALLFVHTGAWSFIWRDLIGQLASDFRCICFDAPGSGRSQSIPQSETTLRRAARALEGVIDGLDLDKFTLVAHDLGGISGISGISRTAERVEGIVAMNTFAWRPQAAGLRFMLALMGSGVMREIDALTNFIARITATPFGIGRHLDDASRRAFLEGMPPRGRRAFHNYMRDARFCDDLYPEVGAALAGPLANLPLLTVFGERNDPFGFQARWKELFPQAVQMVVLKGNHFPMCDAPAFVAQAIRSWYTTQVA